jgi:hypothetical protein
MAEKRAAQRGKHPDFVFTYKGAPAKDEYTKAWRKAWGACCITVLPTSRALSRPLARSATIVDGPHCDREPTCGKTSGKE